MAQIFLPHNVPPFYPHDNAHVQRTVSKTLFTTPTPEQLRRLMEQSFGNQYPIASIEKVNDLLGGITYTVVAGPNKLIAYVPSDALMADSKMVPSFAQHQDLQDTYLTNVPTAEPVPSVNEFERLKKLQLLEAKKVFTQEQDAVLPDPATVPKRKFNFEAHQPSPTLPNQGDVSHGG